MTISSENDQTQSVSEDELALLEHTNIHARESAFDCLTSPLKIVRNVAECRLRVCATIEKLIAIARAESGSDEKRNGGPMMLDRVATVLARVDAGDVIFDLRSTYADEYATLIRVKAKRRDAFDGQRMIAKGRWHYISSYATESEVVQTAWLAWQLFEHHEQRERFTFDGVAIFRPHHPVEALRDFVAATPPDLRS